MDLGTNFFFLLHQFYHSSITGSITGDGSARRLSPTVPRHRDCVIAIEPSHPIRKVLLASTLADVGNPVSIAFQHLNGRSGKGFALTRLVPSWPAV